MCASLKSKIQSLVNEYGRIALCETLSYKIRIIRSMNMYFGDRFSSTNVAVMLILLLWKVPTKEAILTIFLHIITQINLIYPRVTINMKWKCEFELRIVESVGWFFHIFFFSFNDKIYLAFIYSVQCTIYDIHCRNVFRIYCFIVHFLKMNHPSNLSFTVKIES